MQNLPQLQVLQSIQAVEHPSIAASLFDLGMLSDLHVADDLNVSCTLVLPFEGIPANMTAYLKNSLAAAAQQAGGKLTEVRLALMDAPAVERFLALETQNWRG